MNGVAPKILKLVRAPFFYDRVRALAEIRFNQLLNRGAIGGSDIQTFDALMDDLAPRYDELRQLLMPGQEGHAAVSSVLEHFRDKVRNQDLPFPVVYNADYSFASLCYSVARFTKPEVVVETGVGYGISSAVVLLALERNHRGRLISIDLPPISDPHGSFIGIAIPDRHAHRWTLHGGSSRHWLPTILREVGEVGLFISDSANVTTLQKYEFNVVQPKLARNGAALFNNIGDSFWRCKRSERGA